MHCRAWDYEGHRLVNQIALASLPADFPAFALTPEAKERIAFLAGEPDRWRNTTDLPLNHVNGPDHYIDLEQLDDYGLDAASAARICVMISSRNWPWRARRIRKNFRRLIPTGTPTTRRELVGFLPWAIMENYDKLKSAFPYLKTFEAERRHAGGNRQRAGEHSFISWA